MYKSIDELTKVKFMQKPNPWTESDLIYLNHAFDFQNSISRFHNRTCQSAKSFDIATVLIQPTENSKMRAILYDAYLEVEKLYHVVVHSIAIHKNAPTKSMEKSTSATLPLSAIPDLISSWKGST